MVIFVNLSVQNEKYLHIESISLRSNIVFKTNLLCWPTLIDQHITEQVIILKIV